MKMPELKQRSTKIIATKHGVNLGFEKQIEKVKKIQQILELWEAQKKTTSNLYLKSKDVNNDLFDILA